MGAGGSSGGGGISARGWGRAGSSWSSAVPESGVWGCGEGTIQICPAPVGACTAPTGAPTSAVQHSCLDGSEEGSDKNSRPGAASFGFGPSHQAVPGAYDMAAGCDVMTWQRGAWGCDDVGLWWVPCRCDGMDYDGMSTAYSFVPSLSLVIYDFGILLPSPSSSRLQAVWDDHIHSEVQQSAHHSLIAPPLEALHSQLLAHQRGASNAEAESDQLKEGCSEAETNEVEGAVAGTKETSAVEGEGEGEHRDEDGQAMGEREGGGEDGRREAVRGEGLWRESVEEKCVWELVEHARVERRVVVGSVLEGALAAVHAGRFSKANHILHLCPPLRPLTTLIAWDLIGPSHPATRLRLLWALWPHESSQALLPQESAHALLSYKPLLSNSWPSQQVLQHAGEEVARVLSPKAVAHMVRAADPFVARLAVELLQVQPPLPVLLSLGAHCFRPGEIIQLLQAQPGFGGNMLAPSAPPAVAVMESLLAAVAKHLPPQGTETHGMARPFLLDASPLSGVDRRAARALLKRKDVGEVGSGGGDGDAAASPAAGGASGAGVSDADIAAELDAELDAQASDVAAAAVGVLASDWKQRAQVVRDWLDDWQWRLAVLKADWLGVRAGGRDLEEQVLEEEGNLERSIYEEGEEVEKEVEASESGQKGGMEGGGRKAGEVKGQTGKRQEWRLRSDWSAWGWHEVVAWMRVEPSALISCCLSVGDFSLCQSLTCRFPLAVHTEARVQLSAWLARHDQSRVVRWDSGGGRLHSSSSICGGGGGGGGGGDIAAGSGGSGKGGGSRGGLERVGSVEARERRVRENEQVDSLFSLFFAPSQAMWEMFPALDMVAVLLDAAATQARTAPDALVLLDQPHLSPSPGLSGSAGAAAGPQARAVMALQQVVADCEAGTAQFVSGKLHNLIRALEDPEPAADPLSQVIPAPATAVGQSGSATSGGGGAVGGGAAAGSVPAVSARADSQGSVAAAAAVAGLASATGSGGVGVAAGSPVHTPPLSPRWTRSSSGLGLSAAAAAAAAATVTGGSSVGATREGAGSDALEAAAFEDFSEGGSVRSSSLPLPSTAVTTASSAAAPSPLSVPSRSSVGAVSMPPPSTTTTITSAPSAAASARVSAPPAPGVSSGGSSGVSSGGSSGGAARASAPLPPVPRSSMPSLWPFSFNSKQPAAGEGQTVVGLQSLLGSGTVSAAAGLRGPGKQPWDHPKGYLPVFLNYVVQIGDIVDDSDPSHPFNYFSLLNIDPVELLRELVFVRGDISAASHVAGIMGRDSLPADIIPAALPSLLPPVPSLKLCSVARRFRSRLLGRSGGGPGQSRPGRDKVAGGVGGPESSEKLLVPSPYEPPRFALSMDVVQLLARESMVHAVLACVLGAEQQILQMHRRKERERDLKSIGAFSGGGGGAAAATGGGGVGGVLGGDRSRGKGGAVGGGVSAVEAEEEAAKKLMEYARLHSAGLIADSRLAEALELADTWLPEGAPDHLLCLLVEQAERPGGATAAHTHTSGGDNMRFQKVPVTQASRLQQSPRSGGLGFAGSAAASGGSEAGGRTGSAGKAVRKPVTAGDSWRFVIRVADKELAAALALRYHHSWQLSHIHTVFNTCLSHLPAHSPLRSQILTCKSAVDQYTRIRSILNDRTLATWQQ
ncbi:unnamed protein product, partial [Closterium sp. Yama58-4]